MHIYIRLIINWKSSFNLFSINLLKSPLTQSTQPRSHLTSGSQFCPCNVNICWNFTISGLFWRRPFVKVHTVNFALAFSWKISENSNQKSQLRFLRGNFQGILSRHIQPSQIIFRGHHSVFQWQYFNFVFSTRKFLRHNRGSHICRRIF